MSYYQKYLKYKKKYLELKKQKGGGRLVQIYSQIPEISFEPIDLELDDDLYVLKQQILQQLGSSEITYDDLEILESRGGKCTGRVIQHIYPETNELCVRIKKHFDAKKLVPTRITSGLRATTETYILNQTGNFNFSNCRFEGVIEEGRINKANIVFLVKAHGKYTTREGAIIEGSFINDKIEGQTKMTTRSGNIIEGMFVKNELNGPGKIIRTNGTILEGEFILNELVEGSILKPNGDRLEGTFLREKLKGRNCRVIEANGTVKTGEFINNKLVSGKIIYPNGSEDSGEFLNELLVGIGTKTVRTNPQDTPTILYGEFTDGELNGLGKITYPDGRIEEGEFSNGRFIRERYKTEFDLSIKNDHTNANKNIINDFDKDYSLYKII